MNTDSSSEFDFVIIGSGFGGSISAMRLSQKGYSVAVLEKGRRFNSHEFPKTNWDLKNFLWAPLVKCFGIQQLTFLRGLFLLHGAGVGGGSLVYANTLMEPQDDVYEQNSWPQGIHWSQELKVHFQRARNILGVRTNPILEEADRALQNLSKKWKCEETFHPTEVAIYFNSDNKEERDPYFQGEGPLRKPCTGCGACMTGCRENAKNTLDKNYLYFAEKWGAKIFPFHFVTQVKPVLMGDFKYIVCVEKSNQLWKSEKRVIKAKNVILSAGVIGTLKLLFQNKYQFKNLPDLSPQLGQNVRTNGESLVGMTSTIRSVNFSKGIAIGSAMHPNSYTKIEPCRYTEGADLMKFLSVPLTGDGNWILRPLKMLFAFIRNLRSYLKIYWVQDWAKSSVILLVMQSLDQKMNLGWGRGFFFKKTLLRKKGDTSVSHFLPLAQNAASEIAKDYNGIPQNAFSEVLFSTNATAHILGGAILGQSETYGVVNPRHEVFNYPGLYICDGSVIPANLAVNPSLTISALAERFASYFPIKDEKKFKERNNGLLSVHN